MARVAELAVTLVLPSWAGLADRGGIAGTMHLTVLRLLTLAGRNTRAGVIVRSSQAFLAGGDLVLDVLVDGWRDDVLALELVLALARAALAYGRRASGPDALERLKFVG